MSKHLKRVVAEQLISFNEEHDIFEKCLPAYCKLHSKDV